MGRSSNSVDSKLLEKVRKEMIKKATKDMRYYFTSVGDSSVTIHDRTIHKPIIYLNNLQDVSLWVDKLNAMSEEDYLKLIFSKGIYQNNILEQYEEWFCKGWLYETDKILVKLRKEIVTTTLESHKVKELYNTFLVTKRKEEYKNEVNQTTYNTHTTGTITEEKEKRDGESTKALPKKKLIKKSSKGTEKETKSLQTLLDELLKLKQESKISFGDYVKQKRKLIELHS